MSLPVDFEQRVKMAASPTGAGSPVQISAKDLMDNFRYLENNVPDAPEVTEQAVIVIDNGVFKTGQFHITGSLTAI